MNMTLHFEPPDSPRKIYSVYELTYEIKGLLERSFDSVWVEGEISNLHRHGSGHVYLTLKDDRSQIRSVMFRSQAAQLSFEPEHGMRVLCRGRVGVYEVRGEYQLYVDFMEPRGLGALQKAFEQLKNRLAAEGLFDTARKRKLPFLPKSIGIVTSPTGAAIRDILQILDRRFPNLHVLIRPTLVQGAEAAGQIVEAIEDLNSVSGLDLIVLARGGGSLEDLWAFNEEPVARAVFESRLPVVSAVGHEIDFTIADFTADLRAPTPSAAAELIVPQKADLEREIKRLDEGLVRAVGRGLKSRRDNLAEPASRLPDPRRRLAEKRLLLDDLHNRLAGSMGRIIDGSRKTVAHQQALFVIGIKALKPETARSEIDGLSQRLARGMRNTVDRNRTALQHIATLMNTVGPLNVLARGYSITRKLPEGVIVGDASILSKGDRIAVTFSKGDAECTVDKTKKRRDRNTGKGA